MTDVNYSADLALEEGRRAAEGLMISRCVVHRPTGRKTTDPVTSVVSPEMVKVYPTAEEIEAGNPGRFKFQQLSGIQSSKPFSAGRYPLIESAQAHLPVSSQCEANDVLTVLENPHDPDLVGLEVRLVELARGTYRTADRWTIEAVTL